MGQKKDFKAFDTLKLSSDGDECYFVGTNDDGVQVFLNRDSTRKFLKNQMLNIFSSNAHSYKNSKSHIPFDLGESFDVHSA